METVHLLGSIPLGPAPRRFDLDIRIIQIIIGTTCTVFFLALVLRHLPKDAIDGSLTNADPIWIGALMLVR